MNAGYFAAGHLGNALLEFQGIAPGTAASPVSGIPCAILIGLALNNLFTLPSSVKPGLTFCTKKVLQVGIICVGAKLSLLDLVSTGLIGIPAVAASITVGLTFVPWLGRKLGLPHKMSYLIAAGTSICGVTAISAVSPAIKASQKDTSMAIANVVAFGTMGMLTYPYLAHAIIPSSHQIGMFLGLAVHDTSQVMGSALTYSAVYADDVVLKVAAVTKLTRNICLAGVIPGLAYLSAKQDALQAAATGEEKGDSSDQKIRFSFALLKEYIPGFVYGFLGMSLLRSVGDYSLAESGLAMGVWDAAEWKALAKLVGNQVGGHYLLGTAMGAIGLTTSAAALKGVGYLPFVVGFSGALAVAATGFTMAMLLGHFVGFPDSEQPDAPPADGEASTEAEGKPISA